MIIAGAFPKPQPETRPGAKGCRHKGSVGKGPCSYDRWGFFGEPDKFFGAVPASGDSLAVVKEIRTALVEAIVARGGGQPDS